MNLFNGDVEIKYEPKELIITSNMIFQYEMVLLLQEESIIFNN